MKLRTKRSYLYPYLCSLLAALLLAPVLPGLAAEKPNIVLLLIDDMAYGDIGPFGSRVNPTPHLDRLAQEGLKLTSFYAAPVCSASRASVMTGCYAPRVSIPWVLSPASSTGLNPAEHTLPEVLRSAGYSTMMIGKWHLGDQPRFLPVHYGFDHYFGLPYSNDQMRRTAESGKLVVPLIRDEKVVGLLSDNDQDQLTERYTEEAVRFIRQPHAQPFFLYFAHAAVHVPIHPGPQWRGKSGHGPFADWVMEVDGSVGRILGALNTSKADTNTLVFFTSDNGPWLIQGKNAGTAAPLRGGKGSTWEGGMREPTLVWWPGHVPAGAVVDTVCGTIDLLPTFATLAGAKVPADRKIDGADITRLLLGQTKQTAREAQFYYSSYELQAVRSGPWKLALKPQIFSMGMKEGGVTTPGLRLYNLDADIGETTDVAALHPKVVERLQRLAKDMAATLCDGSAKGGGVRPPGRVKNPQPLYAVRADAPPRASRKGASE